MVVLPTWRINEAHPQVLHNLGGHVKREVLACIFSSLRGEKLRPSDMSGQPVEEKQAGWDHQHMMQNHCQENQNLSFRSVQHFYISIYIYAGGTKIVSGVLRT